MAKLRFVSLLIHIHDRKLTAIPHLAGTPANKKLAEDLASYWENLGIKSHITKYDVLLSYPDSHNPNR